MTMPVPTVQPAPRYFIAYYYIGRTAQGEPVSGHGNIPEFRPGRNGKPCILTPEFFPQLARKAGSQLTGWGVFDAQVSITGFQRWED